MKGARKHAELAWTVAAAAPIILGTWLWHHLNQRYPNGEAGNFLWYSFKLAAVFKLKGFAAGLSAAYFDRAPRPTLHVTLGTLFLALGGGSALRASTIASTLYASLAAIYCFRLLRELVSPLGALGATWLLTSQSWFLATAQDYNSELAFFAYGLPALFYGVRRSKRGGGGWTRETTLFAAFAAITLCIRPFEGAVALFPVALIGPRAAELGELVFGLIVFASSVAGVLILRRDLTPLETSLFIALASSYSLWRRRLSPFGCVFLLTAIWFAPAFNSTVEWGLSGATEVFRQISGRTPGDFVPFLLSMPKAVGGWPFALVLVLAAPALLLRDKASEAGKLRWLFLCAAAAAFAVELGTIALSWSNVLRLSYFFFFAIEAGLLALALSDRRFARPMAAVALAAGLAQWALATSSVWPGSALAYEGWASGAIRGYVSESRIAEPELEKDEAAVVFEKLLPLMSEAPRETKVAVLRLLTGDLREWTLDPWSFNLLARERGLAWDFIFTDAWEQRGGKARFERTRQTMDWYIVGPIGGAADPVGAPESEAGHFLYDLAVKGGLGAAGVEKKGEVAYSPAGQDARLWLFHKTSASRP